jgi:uncharacterized membrane protein YdjX (TVP38/TMEM64 family)
MNFARITDLARTEWRALTLKRRLMLAGALVAGIGLVWLYRQIDLRALERQADRTNGAVVFAALVILPLAGFPVSVLHALAGLRFGMGRGFLLVASSIFLQLLASNRLLRLAPRLFERWLGPLRRRLPEGTHGPLTLFTLLLPGAPYFGQIYVLPMIGVPLRKYLPASFVILTARSFIGVVFGHESTTLTPLKLAGFVIYTIVITVLSGWAFQRLQRKMKDRPAGEDGPTPPA